MTKPSMIFLHGGPGFKDYLKPFFLNLNVMFDCEFYDQKQSSDLTIEDLISELNQKVENHKRQPILVGHSWGGVLAVEYTLRFQDKISGLVTMCTGLDANHWIKYREELRDKRLDNSPPEKVFLSPIELKDGQTFLNEMWNGFSEESFDAIFNSYLKEYDLLSRIHEINVPFLNIFGEKDNRFSKIVTKSFKNKNHKIKEIEALNAGHFPFLEENNRKFIISSILDFFKK